jgi:hypothetical protein
MGSNHGDVMHWFKKYNKTMDDVRKDVAALMDYNISTSIPMSTPTVDNKTDGEHIKNKVESRPNSQANEMYRVRKTWGDAASQKGAYTVLKNAIDCCEKAGPGYHVFDSKGNIVYSYGQKVDAPKAEEPKVEVFVPYLAKVNVDLLNYRQGPGINYKINGTIKRNQVYTIIEEKDGWGKLKSGAGWIYLEYTIKA